MWSGPSGGTMAAASVGGGTLAAPPQMSPAFGPMSTDYGMSSLAARNQVETMQIQQMGHSSMRYQQYAQGQMPSPSFVAPNGMQQPYPVDPSGARTASYVGPQCVPTSSYVVQPGYGQAMFDSGSYNRPHPQQMMMSAGSNMQMSYRCQQQFANAQQMRSYNHQQQLMQMQQQQAGVSQQQVVDSAMYSAGIPSATQRTPGMTHPMMQNPQVRGMMMSGYNSGPMSSSGEFLRARAPGPISPAYPTGTNSFSQSQNQSLIIRAGPPMLYSQMQSDLTRQQVVAYPNPNTNFRDPTDPILRAAPPYSYLENRMAVFEAHISPIVLHHNTKTGECNFAVPDEKFTQLRRGEIDIQLKACPNGNVGDTSHQNIWPIAHDGNRETGVSSVSVYLNSMKVEITDLRKAVYLGNFCQQAGNKLVITSSQCVCNAFSFSLRYIRWKSVPQVINDLMPRKSNAFASKQKVLKLIQMDMSQSRISLYPMGPQRLRIPTRSGKCKHTACFDLETFLMCNLESDTFVCPHCRVGFSWKEFEIDQFIAQILAETEKVTNVQEVNIDASTGCWEIIDSSMSMQLQQRAQTPYSKNHGSVPQCPGDHGSVRLPLKRTGGNNEVSETNNTGANGPPLKRIKSESFAMNSSNANQRQDVLAQSPFNPGSVPPSSTSWMPSPNGALPAVSPSGSSVSPTQLQSGQQLQFTSSSGSTKCTGPGTPVTPGSGHNPASVGPSVSPGGTQLQGVMHSQGSVEAVSVAGSAPYTPASVSSLNSGNHCGMPASSIASGNDSSVSSSAGNTSICDITSSLNASALDDVLEDLIFTDAKTSSASEMEMYLRDEPIITRETKGAVKEVLPRSIYDDQDWFDFAQVIAKDP